jgi:hypothetical protein
VRDMDRRLGKLELVLKDQRCSCVRNSIGRRFFCSLSPTETAAAEQRFAACTATHTADDAPIVVLVRSYGTEPLASGRTGNAPRRPTLA